MADPGRPARILLVEDDVADAKLFRLALEERGSDSVLVRAHDCQEALELLDAMAAGGHERPDLVVTDLELPRCSGLDVVRRVRSAPQLRTVPVVVFSSSRREVDVTSAYELGASSYVVKPVDLNRYAEVVGSIEDYWTATVRLPSTR